MDQAGAETSIGSLWRARQSALADFGVEALRAPSLDAVLTQACVQVARGLRAPIAKVMQVQPNSDSLLLRAAVGLPPELATPGITQVPAGHGSEAGYALSQNEPVVSWAATEIRFEVSHIVRAVGARVSVNVVIATRDGPFGTLEVDDVTERDITSDDVDFLRIYATLLGAAVERQRSRASLAMMFDELQTRMRLRSVSSRINSLRLVHEQLYSAGTFTAETVDLHTYLRSLAEERFRTYGIQADRVRLRLGLAPAQVVRDQAVALGLIANEFLTNSLKHAFPEDRTGTVNLELARTDDAQLRVRLADDGVGMTPRTGEGSGRGLGLDIIGALAQQLRGSLTWTADGGTALIVTFPPQEHVE